jgi:hypothetical protein
VSGFNESATSGLGISVCLVESVCLVDAGIGSGRLSTLGYGKTRPIASDDCGDCRAQNRHVESQVK